MLAESERVVLIVSGSLPAAVTMALHRALGIGASEVIRRVRAGSPLIDRGLFLNDQVALERLLREVLDLIASVPHEVHVVPHGASPTSSTIRSESVLWNMFEAAAPPPDLVPPVPNMKLAARVADATRAAWASLSASTREQARLVALTLDEGARYPRLCVAVQGTEQGDANGGTCARAGDDVFASLADVWAPGSRTWDGESVEWADASRRATLEEALRLLDIDAVFTAERSRFEVLLLVLTDDLAATAGAARRLNPLGPQLRWWLESHAAVPEITPAPTAVERRPTGLRAPNPVLDEFWRYSRGLMLDDGTHVYADDEIVERNETFQVAEYAPDWALIGDDSGGRGYLMRRMPPGFDPVFGRPGAEVYLLDLGALTEDIPTLAQFVTDDLIGWVASRQRDAHRCAESSLG